MLTKEPLLPTASLEKKSRQAWQELIKEDSILLRAPGRINLIGEHTDYNEGYVLPAAIDKAVYLALTPRHDNQICLHALDLEEQLVTSVDLIGPVGVTWANYLLGVAAQFVKKGYALKGFEVVFTSDVPIGAGLSSSAAVACAMAGALNRYLDAGLSRLELAMLAQQAEHDYAGVQCGIMDPFASIFGKNNTLIRLDCRSHEYDYTPASFEGYVILLFDTRVRHSLAATAYNNRRQECRRGVEMVQQHLPAVRSLRDVTLPMLDTLVRPFEPVIYKRCRYVVQENDRLLRGCGLLEQNNIEAFGRLMFESHEGLSKNYEVSCPELDFLVDAVRNNSAVAGARMMGGGFGGCTINLVKKEKAAEVGAQVQQAYRSGMLREAAVYEVKVGEGMTLL